ncbi:TPA: phosphatase PAP2 family protein [Klebsiella pneumoniae]|nr:phosphatase PAP2 family protein [Klebsiella pneumoniae]HBU3631677.1 phosphatase PAP2 family protein [Klebsiella pneumoniae]
MAMMKNRIPLILLLNIAGVALFCSWYLPANHGAWLPVDSAIFHFFNHGVSVSHAYAWLLAAVIINQLAQHLMPVQRASPSLFFSDITRVSDVVNFPTKDASKDSFPGDHGMMLLIFASFMWRYFGRRALGVALIIFVVFAFPRVMIGAHWFSDIAVGSLTAVLIGAPWVLMTPLSDKLIAFFDRYLPSRISAK